MGASCCQSSNRESRLSELQLDSNKASHQQQPGHSILKKSKINNGKSYESSSLQDAGQDQQKTVEIKQPPKTLKTRGQLNIFYGTTGGNSARLAANLLSEAKLNYYQAKLVHLGDFDEGQFVNMGRVIFVMSTYGVGGPTLDAEPFYNWFNAQSDQSLLQHMKFAVFGLGNSTFENFAGFGVKVNAKLESLGAERIYKFGRGDAAADTTDKDFEAWKKDIWTDLNAKFELKEITQKELEESEAGFELAIVTDTEPEVDLDSYVFENSKVEGRLKDYFGAVPVSINDIRELRNVSAQSSCLHIEIETPEFRYDTAGNIGVFPENDADIVRDFAKQQGYNIEDIFKLSSPPSSKHIIKLPVPSPLKIMTFLTKFCDFQGPVNKVIVQSLAEIGGNEKFQKKCNEWLTDNDLFYKEVTELNHSIYTFATIFKLRIPLHNLISLSNRLFPRFYTIASSNVQQPKQLDICISLKQFKDPLHDARFGQASYFFKNLKDNFKGKKIRIFHQPSLFQLPQNPSTPIIMIGPGAGVAPFRAFLQEKQSTSDSTLGECTLYFGCRGKHVDFIYQEELEAFEKAKICNNLRVAFSRDGPSKVYVQDLMKEDIEKVGDLVFNRNAVIYVCGSKAVAEEVKQFIINIYIEKQGLAPYSAYSKISEFETDKRLIIEAWG